MTVAIGALLAANALLVALALSVGRQLFVDQLAGTAFAAASRVFFDTLLAYLERGQQVFLGLGLILVVAGWFAGSNRYGTAVRTTVAGGLEGTGTRLADRPGRRSRPVGCRQRRRGCGQPSSCSVSWSCSGATTCPRRGCGGRWRWCSSSWPWCRVLVGAGRAASGDRTGASIRSRSTRSGVASRSAEHREWDSSLRGENPRESVLNGWRPHVLPG